MTPHLEADKGAYADTVLLPGDPLRAQWIAETFLDDAGCVNRVRNMLGFTGTYKGRRVSIQATGMGLASAAIYTTELVKFYGARTLIRVGTCGALDEKLELRDIVLAVSASTDSNFNQIAFAGPDFATAADFGLVQRAVARAEAQNLTVHAGGVLSTDLFYAPDGYFKPWIEHGLLAVEMETSSIYAVAAHYGAQALSILTVSDLVLKNATLPPHERETALADMAKLALETALATPVPETDKGTPV